MLFPVPALWSPSLTFWLERGRCHLLADFHWVSLGIVVSRAPPHSLQNSRSERDGSPSLVQARNGEQGSAHRLQNSRAEGRGEGEQPKENTLSQKVLPLEGGARARMHARTHRPHLPRGLVGVPSRSPSSSPLFRILFVSLCFFVCVGILLVHRRRKRVRYALLFGTGSPLLSSLNFRRWICLLLVYSIYSFPIYYYFFLFWLFHGKWSSPARDQIWATAALWILNPLCEARNQIFVPVLWRHYPCHCTIAGTPHYMYLIYMSLKVWLWLHLINVGMYFYYLKIQIYSIFHWAHLLSFCRSRIHV